MRRRTSLFCTRRGFRPALCDAQVEPAGEVPYSASQKRTFPFNLQPPITDATTYPTARKGATIK